MRDFFDRHARVALMFSGGKDAAACLQLCREFWQRLDVVWCNPGNPYPETVDYMRRVAALVPNFVELRGDQPAFIAEHGYPIDLLPISMTAFGRSVTRVDGVRVVAFSQCCAHNLWTPMNRAIRDGGYTGVIRGDKHVDTLKPPVTSGDVIDGIEYLLPVEHMGDAETMALAGDLLAPHYQRGIRTSLDCRNCTAYVHHNTRRIRELRATDPQTHAEIVGVLRAVDDECNAWRTSLMEI